jgi:hypothetical protein
VRKAERLAILNGFGISIGDSVIGLQALFAGQSLGLLPRPVLFRHGGGREMVEAIYRCARDVADVAALDEFHPDRFDHVVDLRDFAFDPVFRGMAMIDFFLSRLGLDPTAMPAVLRRNAWLAGRVRPELPAGLPARYVLICPKSSMVLRDMPEDVHATLLRTAAEAQGLPVVTQGLACAGAIGAADCGGFAELCGLVASAACVISTDTAMLHLADAFAVPCLAVFPTHRPEWRMRDYPLCSAIQLAARGLPDALEFSRGPADLTATRAAWHEGADEITRRAQDFLRRHTGSAS